jgi:hypothetical protein
METNDDTGAFQSGFVEICGVAGRRRSIRCCYHQLHGKLLRFLYHVACLDGCVRTKVREASKVVLRAVKVGYRGVAAQWSLAETVIEVVVDEQEA